ncbi:MAG: ribosomal protection-like ABC-F family protein [Oscillospiraceae bacterium]
MPLISVNDLTYYYDGSSDPVFEGASFSIDSSWKTGLIGRNGKGKTTLLRLLTGELDSSGAVSSGMEFLYFPFEVPNRELTGSELAELICPAAEQWEILRELSTIGTDCEVLYRPFRTLSGGEQTRLLLCLLFLHDNAFLLIDEPTNCLDSAAREAVAAYLERKSGYILVSHDRDILDRCTDHTLSINRADIQLVRGNYSVWKENYDRRQNFEEQQNEKLKSEITHLKAAARRSKNWADKAESTKIGFDPTKVEKSLTRRAYIGAKSKAMMKRARDIENRREAAVEEKSQLLKNRESAETLKIPAITHKSEVILTLDKVVPTYDGTPLCKPVSFSLRRDQRLCLSGHNGCGKSTLLNIIGGSADISYAGSICKAPGLTISRLEQDASGISGSLDDYAEIHGVDPDLMRAILAKLDFSRREFLSRIETYSEGQKKKVMIACSLSKPANLFIWDEPLNFVDILSRIQLEKLLSDNAPAMLLAEHDRYFCENTGTQRLFID